MRFKLRFKLTTVILLCTIIGCSIAGVFWLRSNTIIRSAISGTLVTKNGERFPTNRWFRMASFDPMVFSKESVDLIPLGPAPSATNNSSQFSVLETKQGKCRVEVILWSYEGSGPDQFRVELLVQIIERIR